MKRDLFNNEGMLKDKITELFLLYDQVGFIGSEEKYQKIKKVTKRNFKYFRRLKLWQNTEI